MAQGMLVGGGRGGGPGVQGVQGVQARSRLFQYRAGFRAKHEKPEKRSGLLRSYIQDFVHEVPQDKWLRVPPFGAPPWPTPLLLMLNLPTVSNTPPRGRRMYVHNQILAWTSWSSADARLAKAMLYTGESPCRRPLSGDWFSWSKTKPFLGCVFERFSPCYGGFAAIFSGPASSAQLGPRFSLTPQYI